MTFSARFAGVLAVWAALAGCGRGGGDDLCAQAARASEARVAAKDGAPAVETMTDVAAARVAGVMRTRCREDGWSARAATCLRDDDVACWRAALTSEQRDRLDEAMQTTLDELRTAPPRPR